jgi:hypothetical protein
MLTYFSLTNVQIFLAVLYRLSQIFELEDHKKKRDAYVELADVCVEVKDVAFSWGFKIKED